MEDNPSIREFVKHKLMEASEEYPTDEELELATRQFLMYLEVYMCMENILRGKGVLKLTERGVLLLGKKSTIQDQIDGLSKFPPLIPLPRDEF
jgi:hypothetical protein